MFYNAISIITKSVFKQFLSLEFNCLEVNLSCPRKMMRPSHGIKAVLLNISNMLIVGNLKVAVLLVVLHI